VAHLWVKSLGGEIPCGYTKKLYYSGFTRIMNIQCIVYIRCSWRGDHQIYGHIQCMYIPYRLGFSPQPQKNILVSHSRINPAPWKYLIYTNPAQGFLPDRLQNTPKIPVFQSCTPKINRYFSCAQSPRRAKNDIFAR